MDFQQLENKFKNFLKEFNFPAAMVVLYLGERKKLLLRTVTT